MNILTGISRYEFQDRLEDRQEAQHGQVQTWRGRDRVLDRPVLLRVVTGELRGPAQQAARRAATVEDQRLTRVLDIVDTVDTVATLDVITMAQAIELDAAAGTGNPLQPQSALQGTGAHSTVIVSEWAEGRTLPQYLHAYGQQPLAIDQALTIMDAISSALIAAATLGVHHERLTYDHVLIAQDESVRIRGLAIDAKLFGVWPVSTAVNPASADVEALGRLLYLLITGVEIDQGQASSTAVQQGATPTAIDPASWLNPSVPKKIDAVLTEILDGSFVTKWDRANVQGFRAALGLTGPTTRRRTNSGWQRLPVTGRRLAGVLVALGVVGVIFVAGAVLLTLGSPILQPRDAEITTVLNSPVVLPTEATASNTNQVLAVQRIRSYDPFDDDNSDGKPDGRKGRENNKAAGDAADGDINTGWSSNTYRTADASGKGGVGIVLELAEPSTIQAVDLDFGSVGSSVEVKVGDDIWPDPTLWTNFATAPAGESQITIRGPRPVKGKYVLLWFPELPPTPEDPERFQVRLTEVVVRGE